MKRRLPPLLSLRAFELAARYLSFSHAAAELNVTPGAVSRHVKSLEQHLHQPLFHRYTRRVELTTFGQSYLTAITAGLDMIEKATTVALSPKTTLKISITQSIASLWLMPRLSAFTETYPDIDVRLVTSMHPVSFMREEVDIAIRLGRLPGKRYDPLQPRIPHDLVESWQGVVAEYLWDEILTPVLSKELMARGPALHTPKDLRQHRLLHVAVRSAAWADWFRTQNLPYAPGPDSLEFGHFFMSLEAARKHLGVALAPTLHIENLSWRDELVCPFPSTVKSAGEYYMLFRENEADARKIRLFRDWVVAQNAEIRP